MLMKYRAGESCRIGGVYRREGEVFVAEEIEPRPRFLQKLGAVDNTETVSLKVNIDGGKRGRLPKGKQGDVPGPMPGDFPTVERD